MQWQSLQFDKKFNLKLVCMESVRHLLSKICTFRLFSFLAKGRILVLIVPVSGHCNFCRNKSKLNCQNV